MEEIIEFRLNEPEASEFLLESDGQMLTDLCRKVVTKVGSPVYERIRRGDKVILERQNVPPHEKYNIYSYSAMRRRYTADEISRAELFMFNAKKWFHPAGEDCGTIYDESTACSYCGGGARRVGPLVLDLRKAPKKHGFAETIAYEPVVSQNLAEWLIKEKITGLELRPVVHKAYLNDEPVDYTVTKTGRELLKEAEAKGIENWCLCTWLHTEEREARTKKAEREFRELMKIRERATPPPPKWYELVITSRPVHIVAPTRWGVDRFDHQFNHSHRCPKGGELDHVKDLGILSEIHLSRDDWDGADICRSVELCSFRMGLLRPAAPMFVSPKLRRLLDTYAKKSVEFEVAYLK